MILEIGLARWSATECRFLRFLRPAVAQLLEFGLPGNVQSVIPRNLAMEADILIRGTTFLVIWRRHFLLILRRFLFICRILTGQTRGGTFLVILQTTTIVVFLEMGRTVYRTEVFLHYVVVAINYLIDFLRALTSLIGLFIWGVALFLLLLYLLM